MTHRNTIRLPMLLLFAAAMGCIASLYVDEVRAIHRVYEETKQ